MRISDNKIFGDVGAVESVEYSINGLANFSSYTPVDKNSSVYIMPTFRGGDPNKRWILIYPNNELAEIQGSFNDNDEFVVTFGMVDVISCRFKEVPNSSAIISNEKIFLKSTDILNNLTIKNNDDNYLSLTPNSLTYNGSAEKNYLDENSYTFSSYYKEEKMILSKTYDPSSEGYKHIGYITKPFPIGLTTWIIDYVYNGKSVRETISYGELPYNSDKFNITISDSSNKYEFKITSKLSSFSIKKYYTITYDYQSKYVLPDDVELYYKNNKLDNAKEFQVGIFNAKLNGNELITTYSSGFKSDGSPTTDNPSPDWYGKLETKPIINGLYFKNKNTDFNINNNVNITGGMTLGGSLTIPSDQSIKIGEINISDLKLISTSSNASFDANIFVIGKFYYITATHSYGKTAGVYYHTYPNKWRHTTPVNNNNSNVTLAIRSKTGADYGWGNNTVIVQGFYGSSIDNVTDVSIYEMPLTINTIKE